MEGAECDFLLFHFLNEEKFSRTRGESFVFRKLRGHRRSVVILARRSISGWTCRRRRNPSASLYMRMSVRLPKCGSRIIAQRKKACALSLSFGAQGFVRTRVRIPRNLELLASRKLAGSQISAVAQIRAFAQNCPAAPLSELLCVIHVDVRIWFQIAKCESIYFWRKSAHS